jgi:hypothetical protein
MDGAGREQKHVYNDQLRLFFCQGGDNVVTVMQNHRLETVFNQPRGHFAQGTAALPDKHDSLYVPLAFIHGNKAPERQLYARPATNIT